MPEPISERAKRLFEQAFVQAADDADRVRADHSAKGLLRSGSTIKRIVEVAGERTQTALNDALASVASRSDHRGRMWRNMIVAVHACIDEHVNQAPAFVAKQLGVIAPNSEPAYLPLLDAMRRDLHRRTTDYGEGWTSPRARPWRERHAFWYAAGLVLVGAVVSNGAQRISAELTRRSSAPAATAAPATLPPTAPPALSHRH